MCVNACVCRHACVCVCADMRVCMQTYVCADVCVHACMHMCVQMCLCTSECVCVCAGMSVSMEVRGQLSEMALFLTLWVPEIKVVCMTGDFLLSLLVSPSFLYNFLYLKFF